MKTENKQVKTVVTFTFYDNDNLGKAFVAALEELYGKDNVSNIDQSTYMINTRTLSMDDILAVLHKAEEEGEKHKEGDELHVLHVVREESKMFSSSTDFQQRLEKYK
jgi:hypothetical protein